MRGKEVFGDLFNFRRLPVGRGTKGGGGSGGGGGCIGGELEGMRLIHLITSSTPDITKQRQILLPSQRDQVLS